ncbi:Unconventional Myosin-Ic, partial [Manis pentadactyla]
FRYHHYRTVAVPTSYSAVGQPNDSESVLLNLPFTVSLQGALAMPCCDQILLQLCKQMRFVGLFAALTGDCLLPSRASDGTVYEPLT